MFEYVQPTPLCPGHSDHYWGAADTLQRADSNNVSKVSRCKNCKLIRVEQLSTDDKHIVWYIPPEKIEPEKERKPDTEETSITDNIWYQVGKADGKIGRRVMPTAYGLTSHDEYAFVCGWTDGRLETLHEQGRDYIEQIRNGQ